MGADAEADGSSAPGVVPCAIGTGPLGIRAAMIDAVGADVLARALTRLPEPERRAYETIAAGDWVPLELSSRVIELVAEEAGRPLDPFFAEMVRSGTLRALDSFYRTLLRFAWDEMLVARAAGAYRRIRNVGRLEATLVRPGHAIAVLRGWPGLSERHARSLGYTMEAFFLAAGKHDVAVDTNLDRRDGDALEGATYRCSWRG